MMNSILRQLFLAATAALPVLAEPAVTPAQQPAAHTAELAALRRQPRDLLDGIRMSKAEKKAVYGIVRRNAAVIRALELRDRAAVSRGTTDAQLESDLVALRDRERVELREVLSVPHRHRFDRNLDERFHVASAESTARARPHGGLSR